jgi:arsenite-transporting ATPase
MLQHILVFGGKGGVGKSSISTATAVYLAQHLPEKRILVISFDIAHNLSDLFNMEIGNSLTQIKDNLWGIEPDPEIYTAKYTKNLSEKARELVTGFPIVGKIPQLEEFINTTFQPKTIPLALKNAIFFQSILDADNPVQSLEEGIPVDIKSDTYKENTLPSFDIIVADFPPTGNMVALFEVPEDTIKHILRYSLEMVETISNFMAGIRKVSKVFNPFSWGQEDKAEKQRGLAREILGLLKDLEKRGERISALMKGLGSLRLVGIPEKPSYEELIRAQEMCKPYIHTDAVHVNRIIPIEYQNSIPFLQNLIKDQQRYLGTYHTTFKDLKIWESEYLDREPIGFEGLLRLANAVYKDATVQEILNPMYREIINPELKNKKDTASVSNADTEIDKNRSESKTISDGTPDSTKGNYDL